LDQTREGAFRSGVDAQKHPIGMEALPSQNIGSGEMGLTWIEVGEHSRNEGEVFGCVDRPAVRKRRVVVKGVDFEALRVVVDVTRHMLAIHTGGELVDLTKHCGLADLNVQSFGKRPTALDVGVIGVRR